MKSRRRGRRRTRRVRFRGIFLLRGRDWSSRDIFLSRGRDWSSSEGESADSVMVILRGSVSVHVKKGFKQLQHFAEDDDIHGGEVSSKAHRVEDTYGPAVNVLFAGHIVGHIGAASGASTAPGVQHLAFDILHSTFDIQHSIPTILARLIPVKHEAKCTSFPRAQSPC
eukprot:9478503-Pyramimonas_sp.AAC.1